MNKQEAIESMEQGEALTHDTFMKDDYVTIYKERDSEAKFYNKFAREVDAEDFPGDGWVVYKGDKLFDTKGTLQDILMSMCQKLGDLDFKFGRSAKDERSS